MVIVVTGKHPKQLFYSSKVSKVAKIRNQYNQVPHLTQDTTKPIFRSLKLVTLLLFEEMLVLTSY